MCESTFSQNRRHDLNRHFKTQHQTEIEGKLKPVFGSELRKEYVFKKNEKKNRRQNVTTKRSRESLAMTEASYEIALALVIKGKLSLTEKKLLSHIFARSLGGMSNEIKADEIALSKQIVTRRTKELSHDVSQQIVTRRTKELFHDVSQQIVTRRTKELSHDVSQQIVTRCTKELSHDVSQQIVTRRTKELSHDVSQQIVTRRTKELLDDVSQQLKDLVNTCTFFSLALD